MKKYNIGSTLKKLHKGEEISTSELNYTIRRIQPLIGLVFELGEKYRIMWHELNFDLQIMKDFITERKRNGTKNTDIA